MIILIWYIDDIDKNMLYDILKGCTANILKVCYDIDMICDDILMICDDILKWLL